MLFQERVGGAYQASCGQGYSVKEYRGGEDRGTLLLEHPS
jgi:hypothetical protein